MPLYQLTKRESAMYVNPVQNVQFKGTTKYLTCDDGGRYKRVSSYSYGSASFGDTRGLSEFVQRHTLPFAKVEEAIGNLHENATYKIYVTDPYEIVNDSIKRQYDYIVYDVEPNIPNLKKYYLESDKEVLKDEIKNILAYFKRLTALNYEQMQNSVMEKKRNYALNCLGMFEDVFSQIEQLCELEGKINQKKESLESTKLYVPLYEHEIMKKQSTIQNHETKLGGKLKRYAIWLNRRNHLYQNSNRTSQDVEDVEKNIKMYETEIAKLNTKISKLKKRVEYLEQYIANAPEQIQKYQSEIKVMESLLKVKETVMLPLLDKLSVLKMIKK